MSHHLRGKSRGRHTSSPTPRRRKDPRFRETHHPVQMESHSCGRNNHRPTGIQCPDAGKSLFRNIIAVNQGKINREHRAEMMKKNQPALDKNGWFSLVSELGGPGNQHQSPMTGEASSEHPGHTSGFVRDEAARPQMRPYTHTQTSALS